MSAAAEASLFWLWQRGATPRQAMEALQRDHGLTLTWEQVRERYARISETG